VPATKKGALKKLGWLSKMPANAGESALPTERATQASGFVQDLIGRGEKKRRVLVHEVLDEPGASHAVDFDASSGNPFHFFEALGFVRLRSVEGKAWALKSRAFNRPRRPGPRARLTASLLYATPIAYPTLDVEEIPVNCRYFGLLPAFGAVALCGVLRVDFFWSHFPTP
jgi:hypothetical protein